MKDGPIHATEVKPYRRLAPLHAYAADPVLDPRRDLTPKLPDGATQTVRVSLVRRRFAYRVRRDAAPLSSTARRRSGCSPLARRGNVIAGPDRR
jgi:hypothetical protein